MYVLRSWRCGLETQLLTNCSHVCGVPRSYAVLSNLSIALHSIVLLVQLLLLKFISSETLSLSEQRRNTVTVHHPHHLVAHPSNALFITLRPTQLWLQQHLQLIPFTPFADTAFVLWEFFAGECCGTNDILGHWMQFHTKYKTIEHDRLFYTICNY